MDENYEIANIVSLMRAYCTALRYCVYLYKLNHDAFGDQVCGSESVMCDECDSRGDCYVDKPFSATALGMSELIGIMYKVWAYVNNEKKTIFGDVLGGRDPKERYERIFLQNGGGTYEEEISQFCKSKAMNDLLVKIEKDYGSDRELTVAWTPLLDNAVTGSFVPIDFYPFTITAVDKLGKTTDYCYIPGKSSIDDLPDMSVMPDKILFPLFPRDQKEFYVLSNERKSVFQSLISATFEALGKEWKESYDMWFEGFQGANTLEMVGRIVKDESYSGEEAQGWRKVLQRIDQYEHEQIENIRAGLPSREPTPPCTVSEDAKKQPERATPIHSTSGSNPHVQNIAIHFHPERGGATNGAAGQAPSSSPPTNQPESNDDRDLTKGNPPSSGADKASKAVKRNAARLLDVLRQMHGYKDGKIIHKAPHTLSEMKEVYKQKLNDENPGKKTVRGGSTGNISGILKFMCDGYDTYESYCCKGDDAERDKCPERTRLAEFLDKGERLPP